jgi:prepilin-type N-terminal cleavage/methylation domain-containing protein
MNLKFQNKGFTLAEVLITLLIIGVVASLVIPAIIQDSQDAELKTALRSFYSTISNATSLIMLDNGGTVKGLFTDLTVMRDLYADKMNISGTCESSVARGNCWVNSINMINGEYWTGSTSAYPGLKLTNGILVQFHIVQPNCNDQYWGLVSPVSCGLIRVDVNGFKNPNTFGKDIFDFHVLSTSVTPRGGIYDNNHSCSGGGDFCAYSVLSNP